jgi:hypothetical protein
LWLWTRVAGEVSRRQDDYVAARVERAFIARAGMGVGGIGHQAEQKELWELGLQHGKVG